MVKYTSRDFGNVIFDLITLQWSTDSQKQSRDPKKSSFNDKNSLNLFQIVLKAKIVK